MNPECKLGDGTKPLEEGSSFSQFEGGRLRLVFSASLARGVGSDREENFTTAVDWTELEEETQGVNSNEDLLSVSREILISGAWCCVEVGM